MSLQLLARLGIVAAFFSAGVWLFTGRRNRSSNSDARTPRPGYIASHMANNRGNGRVSDELAGEKRNHEEIVRISLMTNEHLLMRVEDEAR
jgi:hypothetical protein